MFPSFLNIFPGVFNIVTSYTLTTNTEDCPQRLFKEKIPMLFLMSLNISKKVLPAYELIAVS